VIFDCMRTRREGVADFRSRRLSSGGPHPPWEL